MCNRIGEDVADLIEILTSSCTFLTRYVQLGDVDLDLNDFVTGCRDEVVAYDVNSIAAAEPPI